MAAVMNSRTFSVTVAAPAAWVYAFVANPANLSRWATGLGQSIVFTQGEWVAATAMGPVIIRFAADNPFGVLDHVVTLPSGEEVYVPMRVVANGRGSEIVFTLFQQPGMSEAQYAEDAKRVEQDLRTLKQVLEALGAR